MKQSEPANPSEARSERNALPVHESPIAAEISGSIDIGMKDEALRLTRKVLEKRRILPNEFSAAVRTIGVYGSSFQFFFSSKEEQLPYPDVPTRDITNTWHMGNKTEPHFEKMMQNWCPCRARFVRANVKKALQSNDNHCMILTTNHPTTNADLAVGVLYFSTPTYNRFKARYPRRWSEKKYLPMWAQTTPNLCPSAVLFPLDVG